MSLILKVCFCVYSHTVYQQLRVILADAKQRFSELLSVHVYSVQKSYLKVIITHETHTYMYLLGNFINFIGVWCAIRC